MSAVFMLVAIQFLRVLKHPDETINHTIQVEYRDTQQEAHIAPDLSQEVDDVVGVATLLDLDLAGEVHFELVP